ncbi:hypothetical protein J4462_04150 [Candidatus Pacearchaeota archaeon]|nr:hypothetical protein [Candidatus Pacearchaeota archaeon]
MREKTDSRKREETIISSINSETARSYATLSLADKVIFAAGAALLIAGNIDSERLPLYGIGIAASQIFLCTKCLYCEFRSLEAIR